MHHCAQVGPFWHEAIGSDATESAEAEVPVVAVFTNHIKQEECMHRVGAGEFPHFSEIHT